MKKILVCMSVFVFLLTTPFALFAKQSLSDEELGTTTAQEGVSIDFGGNLAVDPYTSNFAIVGQFMPATQSWGEADGEAATGYSSAGFMGLSNVSMSTTQSFIRLYTTMNIDVGTSGGVTKTFVHLPQVLVHPANMDAQVKMGTTMDLSGSQILGRIWQEQFAVVVNTHPAVGGWGGAHNGYISIANPTGAEGIEIGFGGTNYWSSAYGSSYEGVLVSIPNTTIHQSWGDLDGMSALGYTGAGYLGSDATTFNSFLALVSGTMSVDVGTSGSTTAVIVGLPTVRLLASNIDSHLALCNSKYMGYGGFGTVQNLGTLHTEGISFSPSGSVVISAH